jgi:hypothetical protein
VKTQNIDRLATEMHLLDFPTLIRRFLYDQLYPDNILSSSDVPLTECPSFTGRIRVHNSAVATFHGPCDPSGIGGMRREHIRAVSSWRKGPGRHDCVYLNRDPSSPGVRGMDVVQVLIFFAFDYCDTAYSCALVRWFRVIGDKPDEDTGMWIVEPEVNADGSPVLSVIHLDCIIRAAHLLGVTSTDMFLPMSAHFSQSLASFKAFYLNRFIDHHAFQIVT